MNSSWKKRPLPKLKQFENLFTGSFNGVFFNRAFDKSRLKQLVKWTLLGFGEKKTVTLVQKLKNVGYHSATEAGLSLGIDDLLIPPSKISHIVRTENQLEHTQNLVTRGYLTSVEYLAQVITTWNITNDVIKNQVIAHFRSKDVLNPVYMMAFSGARGNISQVRQLVGMRGLMSDPSGRIIDYAIQSNFREGLTLTEYVISCYGARKGVVDTALRTATSGYLTRRLVDVAQHVVIRKKDCGTNRGIFLTSLETEDKVYMTGPFRLTGRVLAEHVYDRHGSKLLAKRNQAVTPDLANRLFQHHTKILVRSALTCQDKKFVCQLCYGWDLAKGRLVSIGETVGVIAAQSIGEPGTQLTMRTFHTGGVFAGEISKTYQSPVYGKIFFLNSIPGKCVRTDRGEVAFLTKRDGTLYIHHLKETQHQRITKIFLKPYTLLLVKQGEIVYPNQTLAEPSSLDQFSEKRLSFQTITAPISGQVKFRTASIAKSAHNPRHTTFVPLSQAGSEFWILSARIQSFKKSIAPFVKPGDQVESGSTVFFYNIVTQVETPVLDSFHLQQSICFYRLQTLFLVFQSPTKTLFPKTLGLNASSQTAVSIAQPLIKPGTIVERVLPFLSFSVKDRVCFSLTQVAKPGQQKQQTQNKGLSKTSSIKNKHNKNKTKHIPNQNTWIFRRFLTLDSQPWQQTISGNYPFLVSQKTPAKFFIPFWPFVSQTILFSRLKFPRNQETKKICLFKTWLTLLEKQLFLSSSVLPSGVDLLALKSPSKRFSLKQHVQDINFKQIQLAPFFYCPKESLWLIAYLKLPTSNFQLPVSNLFPQNLTSNLNYELKQEPNNQIIVKKMAPFCLYFRLATQFRFQQFYEMVFSKTFRAQLAFKPIKFYVFPFGRLKLPFFPKNLPFFERINQNIQSKAFFLFLNQKEKLQPRGFKLTQNLDHQNSDFHKQTNAKFNWSDFFLTQNEKGFQFSNRQYLIKNFIQNFNKIFNFHEFIQLPFCFETFSTNFSQLLQKPMDEKLVHKKEKIQNTFSGFSLLSNTLHKCQIQMLLEKSQATKSPKKGFFKADVLLYVLINKAKVSSVTSIKYVNSLFLLTVTFSKILVWKQIFKKQNQLLNIFPVKFLPASATEKPFRVQKNSEPSVYYFLKKQFSKIATVRVHPAQIWAGLKVSSIWKRAWFSSSKRRQIAGARLNIIYGLTFLFNPGVFYSLHLWTRSLVQTQPQNSELFDPLFDFYFKLFGTRYYRSWNLSFKTQSQNQFAQQGFIKKWLQSLMGLKKQKTKLRQIKRKVAKKFNPKSKVRSLIRLWFSGRTNKRFHIRINKNLVPFSAYQTIDLPYQTIKHTQLFCQKSYENQFLTKFQTLNLKPRNLSMLFLIAGSASFVNPSVFRANTLTSHKRTQSCCLVQNPVDQIQSNRMFLSLLKQMKNTWLKKQLGYKNVSKAKKTTQTKKTTNKKSTIKKILSKSLKLKKTRKSTNITKKINTKTKAKTKAKTNAKTNANTKITKTNKKANIKTNKKANTKTNKKANIKTNKKANIKINTKGQIKKKPLKPKKATPMFQKETILKSGAGLFSIPIVSLMFQQQIGFNKYNHLNPFGWVSFVSSSNRSDLRFRPNQIKSLTTGPKRETFFAFFQNKFHAVCDPWWRHKMHQTHVLASVRFFQKQKASKKINSIKFFLKHPNRFFASYLENNFFNMIMDHTKNPFVFKQIFLNELTFYMQTLELKVKKKTRFQQSRSLNVEILNKYVRFAFLKTAKLPLIVAGKNPIEVGFQKRFLLFEQHHILVSKSGRYRPALVFDSVKYKKAQKKSTKQKIQLVTKSPYFLAMLQKGIVYRTGESLAKAFGQTKADYLTAVSLSGKNPSENIPTNNQHKVPALNFSTKFHTSRLTSFQRALFQSYLKPISGWFMLYKPPFKATHIYLSQQFNTSGPLIACKSKHIQIRDFGLNPFVDLKKLMPIEKSPMNLKKEEILQTGVKRMTVTSPIDGLIVQCYDGKAKAKEAGVYEYDMRRFRDQPKTTCKIAYLTDRDMLTYLVSLPFEKLGAFISYGEKISNNLLNEQGQIISITKTQFILRKAQRFYLSAGSQCHVDAGDLVSFGTPLVDVAYSQIQAEDIIQGIPKIDQFFEARTRFGFLNLKQLLSKQYNFLRKKGSHTKEEAILESIDFIQKKIVDGVQTVYQSQGVTISDKHVEVIVKQMTSKARVTMSITPGFLKGDLVSLTKIQDLKLLEDEFFECEPILFGITQTSLQAEGFLSSASFQETVRVLTQATVGREIDYLKHLKENIIVGHLLPTGTGLIKNSLQQKFSKDQVLDFF